MSDNLFASLPIINYDAFIVEASRLNLSFPPFFFTLRSKHS